MTVRRYYTRTAPLLNQPPIDPNIIQEIATQIVERNGIDSFISYKLISSGDTAILHYPIVMVEFFMESVYYFTGIPWWATIVAVSVFLRFAMFPFFLKSMKMNTKLMALQPEMVRLREKMQTEENKETALEEMRAFYAKEKVNPLDAIKYAFIQIPVLILFFFAIREMCITWPEFTTGGFGFFENLSSKDPFLRLPLITAFASLLIFETTPKAPTTPPVMVWVARFLCASIVIFAASFPMGLHVYWITSSFMSVFITLAFRLNGVRRFFGLPDIKKIEKK